MSRVPKSDVRIQTLKAARVVRFHALGTSPEADAWDKAKAWAEPLGLLQKDSGSRVFGRNNPPPSPGSGEYGYEFFIELRPGDQYESVQTEDLAGGLCAVLACRGVENLPDAWRRLYRWVEESQYEVADHGLEHHLNPNEADLSKLSFDLWLPVKP